MYHPKKQIPGLSARLATMQCFVWCNTGIVAVRTLVKHVFVSWYSCNDPWMVCVRLWDCLSRPKLTLRGALRSLKLTWPWNPAANHLSGPHAAQARWNQKHSWNKKAHFMTCHCNKRILRRHCENNWCSLIWILKSSTYLIDSVWQCHHCIRRLAKHSISTQWKQSTFQGSVIQNNGETCQWQKAVAKFGIRFAYSPCIGVPRNAKT